MGVLQWRKWWGVEDSGWEVSSRLEWMGLHDWKIYPFSVIFQSFLHSKSLLVGLTCNYDHQDNINGVPVAQG
jgi:hypothetical protein